MFSNLQGYRTYICLGVCALAFLGNKYYPEVLSKDIFDLILTVFGFGTVAALRAAFVTAIQKALMMTPPCPITDSSADQPKGQ